MTVRERLVQYPSGGLNMHGFLATPESPTPRPGILIIHEWWGLNDHMRDMATRIAKAGYVALAPDLYSRLGHVVTPDAQEASTFMQSLKEPDALKDLLASLTYLTMLKDVRAARLAVIGFCMGGSYALRMACTVPQLSAAVPFYGQIPSEDQLRAPLQCPVLYMCGGRDEWIKRQDVDRLRQALQRSPTKSQVHVYEQCGHAFFNNTRPEVYHAAAAQDAWQKTLAFLNTHLS